MRAPEMDEMEKRRETRPDWQGPLDRRDQALERTVWHVP